MSKVTIDHKQYNRQTAHPDKILNKTYFYASVNLLTNQLLKDIPKTRRLWYINNMILVDIKDGGIYPLKNTRQTDIRFIDYQPVNVHVFTDNIYDDLRIKDTKQTQQTQQTQPENNPVVPNNKVMEMTLDSFYDSDISDIIDKKIFQDDIQLQQGSNKRTSANLLKKGYPNPYLDEHKKT